MVLSESCTLVDVLRLNNDVQRTISTTTYHMLYCFQDPRAEPRWYYRVCGRVLGLSFLTLHTRKYPPPKYYPPPRRPPSVTTEMSPQARPLNRRGLDRLVRFRGQLSRHRTGQTAQERRAGARNHFRMGSQALGALPWSPVLVPCCQPADSPVSVCRIGQAPSRVNTQRHLSRPRASVDRASVQTGRTVVLGCRRSGCVWSLRGVGDPSEILIAFARRSALPRSSDPYSAGPSTGSAASATPLAASRHD